MMNFDIQRLSEDKRAALVAHFLALPLKDRTLRFGTALATTLIAAYVDDIDFGYDGVFGVRNDQLMLVAVAHVAIEDDEAELALSVLPTHRGRGLGTALFARGAAHARDCRVARLLMHCRSANTPVMRIAHRFGMDIFASGGDADAYLDLQSFVPATIPVAGTDARRIPLLSEAL
jgi:hypothetical protein